MKKAKKHLCILLAAVLCLGTGLAVNGQEAEAAGKVVAPKKAICGVGASHASSFTVDLAEKGDTIKNIKVYQGSKRTKNLYVRKTYLNKGYESETYSEAPYARINFYAKKAGTYKIKFDVYKSNKKKRTSRTVSVYANGTGDVISSVTIDGRNVSGYSANYTPTDYYTTKNNGRIKFNLAKGYKIKNIKINYYSKNGNEITKTFKNGKKATFGKYAYSYSSSYSAQNSMWAVTRFDITYKNSYAKNKSEKEGVVSYYVNKRASKWYKAKY